MVRKTLKHKLIDAIKAKYKVSDEDIERAEHIRQEKNIRFVDALVQLNIVDEKDLAKLIHVEFNIPFQDLSKTSVNKELLR